jgi:hypothetical protein
MFHPAPTGIDCLPGRRDSGIDRHPELLGVDVPVHRCMVSTRASFLEGPQQTMAVQSATLGSLE